MNFRVFSAGALLLAAASFLATALLAQNIDAQLEQRFKDEFKGKVLLLRDFASDKEIKINGDGKLQHQLHPGIWPLGYMEVAEIRTEKKTVQFEGPRVALRYDDARKKLVSERMKERVSISVAGPFNGPPDEVVQRVRTALFIPEGSQLDLLPDYWKEYYEGNETAKNITFSRSTSSAAPPVNIGGEDWFRCSGGGMKPPKALHAPSPEYSEAARELKFKGINMFTLVISKTGDVSRLFVMRPLGMGLDENSVATMKTWKFSPGTREGQPVNCIINVENNFNLY